MAQESLFRSSIGRKFTMALSAIFLLVFLLMHFISNFMSLVSAEAFNSVSHFLGYNPFIQYAMQPILLLGVVYHFVMGVVLEIQNRNARPIKYAKSNSAANSSWASRNMILSGGVILAFLVLHLVDFWWPEINHKYVEVLPEDPNRYYEELLHRFSNPVRVGVYVLAFFLLMLHLLHGFQSAFQSVGANHRKYTPFIQMVGKVFAIAIPVGFMLIAIINYLKTI